MDWIKAIRKARNMTGREVAASAGVSEQHYNYIENGARRPSVEAAKRIAGVLGFEWTRFFEDEEPEKQ